MAKHMFSAKTGKKYHELQSSKKKCGGVICSKKPSQDRANLSRGQVECYKCYEKSLLLELGMTKRSISEDKIFEPRPQQIKF